MSFSLAWRSYHGGEDPQKERDRSEREYNKARDAGQPLREFDDQAAELGKRGGVFRLALTSWINDRTPEPAEPVPPFVKPEVRQKLDTTTAPPAKVAPPPARAERTLGFEEVWAEWPKNLERPEPPDRARGAWEAAVKAYGAEAVVRTVKKLTENERPALHPRYFSTVCRDVLPAMVAAEPTEQERADALIDISLMPKVSREAIEDEDAAVAAWKRVVKPEDRVSFRVACRAYRNDVKRRTKEIDGYTPMSWESFLSRWRTVDTRRVAASALADCGQRFTIDQKGMPFAEALRETVEVVIPKLYENFHEDWEASSCTPSCDHLFALGCKKCGKQPEPIVPAYDVGKILADVYVAVAAP